MRKPIRLAFEEMKAKHPEWGDVIIFSEVIYNKNFSKKEVRDRFEELVSKKEYLKSEKDEIIEFLQIHSKRKPLIPKSVKKPKTSKSTLIL